MPYLVYHKTIRLPKWQWEEGLYLPYSDKRDNDGSIKKYALTKDKIFKEDDNFLYFKFPFKHDQVVKTAV